MSWANRLLAVVNTFTGRPTPTTKDPAYLVSSALVNANFQADMLAVAFCSALGTECVDNTSTNILCKLKPPAGRVGPGDRLTIIEDRPTLRTWCAVVAGTAAVPIVEFADAQLQDSTLAGTADYNTIKDDLILLQVAPADSAVWPKQSILFGGTHGVTGTDIPWKYGETDTMDDKFQAAVGPAGSDGQIQYNDGGNFGASETFCWLSGAVGTVVAALSSIVNVVISSAIFGKGHTVVTGGDYVFVAGADHSVTADGDYGTALGYSAKLSRNAQVVNANGLFATAGDAQHTISLVRKLETNDAAGHLIAAEPLESGKSYAVNGRIIAQTTGAAIVSDWKFEGTARNIAGTSSLIAAITPTLVAQDVAGSAWGVAVAANDGTDTLDVTVSGGAGTMIGWVLMLELVENGY